MRLFDLLVVPPVWLITLAKIRGISSADRQDRALWALRASLAVSFTIGVPAVRRVIDAGVGIPSFANLPVHLLSLVVVAAFFEFVREATGADETPAGRLARSRWAVLAVSALGLIGFFAAMPHPDDEADLLTANVGQPLTDGYWAIFLGYVSFGCVTGARLCWRYGRHALPGPSRTSMKIIGVATVIGAGYVAQRLLYLLADALGWRNLGSRTEVAGTQGLLAASMILLVLGMSWPSLTGWARRRRTWRHVRAVRPLWVLLKAATPGNVLPLPRELRKDPDLVLYRHVIEIHDAALALDRHLRPADRVAAEGALAGVMAPGTDRGVAVEAVLLLLALEADRTATAARGTGSVLDTLTLESSELADEIDWFRQVAAMVRSTPVVRAVRGLESTVGSEHGGARSPDEPGDRA